jgi:hypothetical protein
MADSAHSSRWIKICTASPPPIDTAFFDNAYSRKAYAAKPLPPVYPTERMVAPLLRCAEPPGAK